MPILLLQQRDARGERRRQRNAHANTHAFEKRRRDLQLADALAFRLDKDRAWRIELLQSGEKSRFEASLRRLRAPGNGSKQRASMTCEPFEVERLRACAVQRAEESAFSRAGETADHDKAKSCRRDLELLDERRFGNGAVYLRYRLERA